MKPQFLYFDLGNVLLTFSNERACEQMAAVAGVSYEDVAQLVIGPHERESLLWRFEHGLVSEDEFFERFCRELNVEPDRRELEVAAADMFAPIESSFALVQDLKAAGHRLGILSNTNPVHWRFLTDGRFPVLCDVFEQNVTSFDARSMKPDRKVYDFAVQKCGVPAEGVFFVDDRIENVEGAITAGLNAVQYTDHDQLEVDLKQRGIEW
ncbi:HAD family phosphatase [Aeoliella sp. ICT_H6.2]|uniref:HAD family phosphatase n=1 Tax=Aeoliella straminimaris TaxID=2954799 RepID=A0A9X2JJV5_9BACT|nr:HAD family phosphatase [Aeoliella straminimaris]MCO6045449.1 HAD family phosphatase [Aeoliella straminimaris]